MENIITIRFVGGGMAPGQMPPQDIARVMNAMNSLAPAGEEELVGFYGVEEKSFAFNFSAGMIAFTVFNLNIGRISSGTFDGVSRKIVEAVNELSGVAKRNNCKAILSTSNSEMTADIDEHTSAKYKERSLKAATTLTGKIISIGGKKTPKAKILYDGVLLSCDISEAKAKRLGALLYEYAHLTGTGRWDANTKQWLSFEIESFVHFPKKLPSQMFKELKDEVGSDAFEEVDDILSYCRELREGGAP